MAVVFDVEARAMLEKDEQTGADNGHDEPPTDGAAGFNALELRRELLAATARLGWAAPTEIQRRCIPLVAAGHDLVGVAQTGTGKTAAFVLPVLERLAELEPAPPLNPYCVVLGPTRELAQQTAQQFADLGRGLNVRVITAYGGTSDRPQTTALAEGVEVIVGAPGRVLDLMRQGYLQYEQLVFLVLDEADRMFDMGFIDEVKNILNRMPARRQTLMFSATIPAQVKRLAQDYLIYPEEVRLGPTAPPKELVHEVWPLREEEKYDALRQLLRGDVESAVVFCRTKKGAAELGRFLARDGERVATIHADRLQKEREQALTRFKTGDVRLLVATDVASRGLDVEGLDLVVNYDVPRDAEDYVHRVGRTARVNRPGLAVTLMTRAEERYLARIEQFIKAKITRGGPYAQAGRGQQPATERPAREDRAKAKPRRQTTSKPRRQESDKPRRQESPQRRSATKPAEPKRVAGEKAEEKQAAKPRKRRRRGGRGRSKGKGPGTKDE